MYYGKLIAQDEQKDPFRFLRLKIHLQSPVPSVVAVSFENEGMLIRVRDGFPGDRIGRVG